MKRIIVIALLSTISLVLISCLKDTATKTYTLLKPVYMDKAQVLASIKSTGGQPMESPGKIYVYGKYLFVNDINKGVHVVDNSNPSNPLNVAFINIPGNIDIAVKESTLYADIYTDMVAIDITNPIETKLTKVVKNVFPERVYANGFMSDSSKYIVDWSRKDTTVPNDNSNWICARCGIVFQTASFDNSSTAPTVKAATLGVGGSMARFSIINNYLYTANMSSIGVYDITATPNPVLKNVKGIGWNIETMYPFQDKLFLGSSTGMFIVDISTPTEPKLLSSFNHARACDPVVTNGEYAFVTLRSGTICTGTANQLDIINVKDPAKSFLLKSYAMTNPFGLGIDGNTLCICDGAAGLKFYDLSNIYDLKLIGSVKNINPLDVIMLGGNMIVTTSQGILQYNYSNPSSPVLLSKISAFGK